MLIRNKFHLSYCTNIHPGENWADTFANLKNFLPGIKAKVSDNERFGIGLRLSNLASRELDEGIRLMEFRDWLDDNDLYVFTMNGFPYGNFHHQKVKDFVYAPDWTSNDRLEYTLRLAKQLSYLLPDGVSGSISTCPLSYKHWHSANEDYVDITLKKSAINLSKAVAGLYRIENLSGKFIHLDIEPEPDGLIENSDEFIHYFREYLVPCAVEYLSDELNVSIVLAEEMVYKYIRVCYDVCHFSLAYEEPVRTFKKFIQTGIKIGKIQISSALKVIFEEATAADSWKTLALFNESTYLHQVTEKVNDQVITYSDLNEVLNKPMNFREIRAHFHVPIFVEKYGTLSSTQDQILKVVEYLLEHNISDHLEVETYTWEVLPADLKMNLSDSIVRELNWLIDKFQSKN